MSQATFVFKTPALSLNTRSHLGFVPNSVAALGKYRLDFLFGRPDRSGLTVTQEMWKGQDCYRIVFKTERGPTAQIWIVPAWGGSVVKVQLSGQTKAGKPLIATPLIETVETEVAPAGPGGIWFPRVCTYTRTLGGELEKRQVAKVEVVSINQPIDPRAFSLAGMDLPARTPVVTGQANPKKAILSWDGEKLVDATNILSSQRSHPSIVDRPDAALRLWLWAAAAAGLVLTGTAIWRLKRTPA